MPALTSKGSWCLRDPWLTLVVDLTHRGQPKLRLQQLEPLRGDRMEPNEPLIKAEKDPHRTRVESHLPLARVESHPPLARVGSHSPQVQVESHLPPTRAVNWPPQAEVRNQPPCEEPAREDEDARGRSSSRGPQSQQRRNRSSTRGSKSTGKASRVMIPWTR